MHLPPALVGAPHSRLVLPPATSPTLAPTTTASVLAERAEVTVCAQTPCECPSGHHGLGRDSDVLDTWFSSALWPFSTMGWPDDTPDLGALLSDVHARHRLRHHLLLGRPHDDDGHSFHGRRPVPRRLRPRLVRDEQGQKMSKSKGNVIDPLELHRSLRHRRPALHAGGPGGHRTRHQALGRSRRGLPELRQQDLERRALRPDERRRRAAGRRWAPAPDRLAHARRPLDSPAPRRDDGGGPLRARRLSLQRSRFGALPIPLVGLLRLVSRDGEDLARRTASPRRDAPHIGRGARAIPSPAPSVHAVPHGRALAGVAIEAGGGEHHGRRLPRGRRRVVASRGRRDGDRHRDDSRGA